jgi:hypothetical protein
LLRQNDQRLVRALIVEDVDKLVKVGLLLQNIGGQAIANFASTETADSLRKGCCEAEGLVFCELKRGACYNDS